MKSKKRNRSGKIMLVIVIATYLTMAIFNSSATYDALLHSFKIVKMILPILAVVIFLTTLLNLFINTKKISKHLGEESGIKGVLIALVSGVLSHGPGYVWFPMLKELHSHGMQDGLIVTFFYARAIKIPWLPMMVSYFGTTFAITLTLYTLLAAVIQGIIANKFLKR